MFSITPPRGVPHAELRLRRWFSNSKVEFIHISADSSEEAAEEWAAKEGFPWLTVVPDDVKRSDLMEFKTKNSVPHYVMVDASGNRVANSSAEVFNKIAEVSKAVE